MLKKIKLRGAKGGGEGAVAAVPVDIESGGSYEGASSEEGKREGRGTMRFKTGEVYAGEWVGGQPEGEGSFSYINKNKYVGQWRAGRQHGRGTLTYAFKGGLSAKYEGDWVEDKKDGRGTYTFTDGSVYEGEWVQNVQEGQGKMTLPNGCVYIGDFVGGAREGRGTFYWPSGFAEISRFKHGKGLGEGVRWSPDRAYALRLKDGKVVGADPTGFDPAIALPNIAISEDEVSQIAKDIGLPVPPMLGAALPSDANGPSVAEEFCGSPPSCGASSHGGVSPGAVARPSHAEAVASV